MATYRVTVLHDACTTHDVQAESDSDAVQAALDEAHVSLCHQCSGELELGDPVRAVFVENLETGEFNDDADPDFEVVRLRATVDELLDALRNVVSALNGRVHSTSALSALEAARAAIAKATGS